MKMILGLSALLLIAAAVAPAATITITNTGIDVTGNIDNAWEINGGTAYVTGTSGFPFPAWIASNSTSKWLSPRENYYTVSVSAPGAWHFTTEFELPLEYKPGSAVIQFRFAVDNNLGDVLVNGSGTATGPLGTRYYMGQSGTGSQAFEKGYGQFSQLFTLDTTALHSGTNTLDFVVNNLTGDTSNPVGLNVRFEEATFATPEPGSFALMSAVGLALLVLGGRKRFAKK